MARRMGNGSIVMLLPGHSTVTPISSISICVSSYTFQSLTCIIQQMWSCSSFEWPTVKFKIIKLQLYNTFKGFGMGTLFVLVTLCFRENVVVTCKIGSFLCNLDNLLQKNVIIFSFGNQISKWHSFEKRALFDLLFTFF